MWRKIVLIILIQIASASGWAADSWVSNVKKDYDQPDKWRTLVETMKLKHFNYGVVIGSERMLKYFTDIKSKQFAFHSSGMPDTRINTSMDLTPIRVPGVGKEEGTMTPNGPGSPPPNDSEGAPSWSWLWALGLAAVAFGFVVGFSQTVLGVSLTASQTIYAMAMGLLGSSLYLLYAVIGAIPSRTLSRKDAPKNWAGLLVGPIAGWLSYFMYVTAGSSPTGSGGAQSGKAIGGSAQIWLPFLAGFSSDLMVGIINQAVFAIKYTLGLERGKNNDE